MSDEARHVAFGVLSLKEYYAEPHRRRAEGAPGVRLRGRGPHARPVPPAGGLGADGRRPCREAVHLVMQAPAAPGVPVDAVLEDRPELQEARAARRQRRLAARRSPSSASSSSRTGPTPARSTRCSSSPRVEHDAGVTGITAIGFDGDDTLWESETQFHVTNAKVRQLLADEVDADRARRPAAGGRAGQPRALRLRRQGLHAVADRDGDRSRR